MNQGAYVTLVGFVAREPDIRDTGDGVLVADVRIGTAGRVLDRKTGQWKDVEPQYFTVNCWRKMANYVKASLRKGDPVYVRGRMKLRNYVDKLDRPRTEVEIVAEVLGPDVSRTVASCIRPERPRREIENELATGEENRELPARADARADAEADGFGLEGPDGPDDPGTEGMAIEAEPAPPEGPASGVRLNEEDYEKLGRQLAEETEAELAEAGLTGAGQTEAGRTDA
jgi:single stranded DNA-binding protein